MKKNTDPFHAREAEKYAIPIPSREFIITHLEDHRGPVTYEQLLQEFGLAKTEEQDALRHRLRAMMRDGQLVCNRKGEYGLINRMDLIRGFVVGHPDGHGWVEPEGDGEDIMLYPKQMRALFPGDLVLVCVVGMDRRGRREGRVVEILERNTRQVVGRLFQEEGVSVVVPDERRICQSILIPNEYLGCAKMGQMVVAEILAQPTFKTQAVGKVTEVLGEHMGPGMEIHVAVRAHGLPFQWSEEVLAEVAQLPDEVLPKDCVGREDLRALPLVTIDGSDARDFDDAIYCEKKARGGWRLWVAIADVAHYVNPNAALDKQAFERGNSVYFPENVIPMLPEKLSNGLCSLNPRVDRLCMVCEMHVTSDGKISRHQFYRAVMHSKARLTYDQVAMWVAKTAEPTADHSHLLPHLEELHRLYKVLRKEREKRGAIDFETTETKIVFDINRKIEEVVPVVRNDAHRMIEECMLAANVCTAKFLQKNKLPTLYRVHAGPKLEKLTDVQRFLGGLGLSLSGGKVPTPADYRDLIEATSSRAEAHLIQTVLLRSMSQAFYTPENTGHFGLAFSEYVHFTSPIRRYPDLVVHRGIAHILAEKNAKDFLYSAKNLTKIGEHCSMTERRADEATRDAVYWLKCEFMLDKIGAEFPGIITGVTGFGCFVELEKVFIEGLVHITALGSDYFHFDPMRYRLRGERTGASFSLGDHVRVRVVRVNLDDRKIDFELVKDSPQHRKSKPPKRRRR